MMSRRAVRWTGIVGGIGLLAGLRLAPGLTGSALLLATIAWLGVLAWLLWLAFRILRATIGPAGAALLVALGVLAPILVTAIRFPPDLAVKLPCPRNWSFLPTWQLRASPMASARFEVGGAQVKVCYGSPATRGRRMLGSVVSYGRLWRTGANEPTTIISTAPLEVAGVPMPAGRASLYTVPGPETWEVILNRSTTQWGIESAYDSSVKANELGHAILAAERLESHADRLRIRPEAAGTRIDLLLEWEGTRVRIPVQSAR